MFNLGELLWKITGDNRDFKKSVKDSDKEAKKFSKSLSVVGKAAIAAFAVGVVLKFTKSLKSLAIESLKTASAAEEISNKFNVTFAGLTAADEAARNLAEGYGLSAQAAKGLLSDTADLLQGFNISKEESLELSLATQQLGADLASFTNFAGGAAGASQALTQAILGQGRAVLGLGIVIQQADLKQLAEEQGLVFSELTRAEKAFLTLELAARQSGNAIGDFERSIDSFANQSRIAEGRVEDLKTVLGNDLLPISTLLITTFNDLTKSFIDARQEIQNYNNAIKGDFNADFNRAIETSENRIVDLTAKLTDLREGVLSFGGSIGGLGEFKLEEQLTTEREILKELEKQRDLKEETVEADLKLAEAQKKREDAFLAAEEAERSREESRIKALDVLENYSKNLEDLLATEEEQLEIDRNRALQTAEGWGFAEDAINDYYDALINDSVLKAEEEAAKERQKSIEDYSERLFLLNSSQTERIEKEREAALLAVSGWEDAENAVNDYYDALLDSSAYDFQKKALNDLLSVVDSTVSNFGSSFSNLFGALNSLEKANNDATLQRIQSTNDTAEDAANAELDRLQTQIEAYEVGTDRRIELEEEYNKRSTELEQEKIKRDQEFDKISRNLQRDQAKREKDLAIFNTILSTSSAIIGFLANPGGFAGLFLSGLAAVSGAVQLAAIQSQPLPALQDGGIVPASPGGRLVRVGEAGQDEAIVPLDNSGQFQGGLKLIVNLDGQTFIDFFQKSLDNREITIESDSII